MVLSNSNTAYRLANKGGYAVGHFNIMNLETMQALVNASIQSKQYVFMGCSMKTIKYMGLDNITCLAKNVPRKAKIILHLDHGDEKHAVKCIKSGFTSVMFDGSMFDFEKNVKKTKKIVRMAHRKSISVEAELGRLGNIKDLSINEREKNMTNPESAKAFVEKTGCDSLAISIGNYHGYYEGEPVIDFRRLEQIRRVVKIPLVLHGASGLPDSEIRLAVKKGIRKINIDTELRWSFANAVHDYMDKYGLLKFNRDSYDLRKIIGAGREGFEKEVLKKIRLFHP